MSRLLQKGKLRLIEVITSGLTGLMKRFAWERFVLWMFVHIPQLVLAMSKLTLFAIFACASLHETLTDFRLIALRVEFGAIKWPRS